MLQLPAELLAHIFIYCLPNDPYIEPNTAQAPLLLVQVCHHWKELALRTNRLWCSLSAIQHGDGALQLPPMRRQCMNGYVAWLSRSGNCPLSLQVPFHWSGRWSDEWLKNLLDHKRRFQRLRLIDEYGLNLNMLLNGAEMLNFLSIKARFNGRHNLTLAQPTPSLCALVLDNVYAGQATLSSPTWANLTQLAIRLPFEEGYQLREFDHLVSRCPNLQNLMFGRLDTESANPPTLRCHPNLRSLTIILGETGELDNISCILSLPALISLRVQCDFGRELEDDLKDEQAKLTAMMVPENYCSIKMECEEAFLLFDVCWMNLTHLEVEFRGHMYVFHMVLESCPSLQVLELISHLCDDRCTSLSAPATHPTLSELFITVEAPLGNLLHMATLPQLRHLEIMAACRGEHEDLQGFLARSHCPLETLKIHMGYSMMAWTEEERENIVASLPTLTKLELRPFVS
ncbi:hypothetical protein J3R83DRAFT_10142 [Lanmaoa asiatica]|nr:hypothetical protein J3R83DRAFT_10142 [Lanmaoa asiatica]